MQKRQKDVTIALGNIIGLMGNLTPAQRAKVISALDRMYREHYSTVQIPDDARVRMSKRLAYVRGEISEEKAAETFGSFYGEMKDLKEKCVRAGLLAADRAVISHLYNVIRGAVKTTYKDLIARDQEIEAILYELNVACETILKSKGVATDSDNKPKKEDVFDAVAKSFNDYRRQGLLRPEATKKAIHDSIDDVRVLGLWCTNKGRPDEGEPGSSWKACYQALYDKGYLKKA